MVTLAIVLATIGGGSALGGLVVGIVCICKYGRNAMIG